MNTMLKQVLNQQRGRIADMSPQEARKEWEDHRDTYSTEGKTTEQNLYACRIQDMRYLRSLEEARE
jgi:hypothetical protein